MSQDSTAPEVIYKDVPGFPGYRVGDDGSVWTCKVRLGMDWIITDTWRQSKPAKDRGYLHLKLCRQGKVFNRFVHRLVLEAFVGPCPPGHECAHDNGIRTDCRLSNLAWKTKKENAADRDRHKMTPRGEKHGVAKLTEAQVLEIRAKRGTASQESLAAEYGVAQTLISAIHLRRIWLHI